MKISFPTDYTSILTRMEAVNPVEYAKNRNYIDGDVSYLSPYISRGVISTRQVLEVCLRKGYGVQQVEKFVQELAWRDYWQRIWQQKDIDIALKHEQTNVSHEAFPVAILEAKTEVKVIDDALHFFAESGYMHNHVRMYVSSLITNLGQAHWKLPAKWMYYHLLDGDWASNALSWQWVCGANSNKKYYANQENINKFCRSSQSGTFLDLSYEGLMDSAVPAVLEQTEALELKTVFPEENELHFEKEQDIALYTWYNMDPEWRKEESLNRILILEPSHFKAYPISEKSMTFLLGLKGNIPDIQVFVGEFHELQNIFTNTTFLFKEHPTNRHFKGIEDERDWISSVEGYYPSFFGFWKKVKKEINS